MINTASNNYSIFTTTMYFYPIMDDITARANQRETQQSVTVMKAHRKYNKQIDQYVMDVDEFVSVLDYKAPEMTTENYATHHASFNPAQVE